MKIILKLLFAIFLLLPVVFLPQMGNAQELHPDKVEALLIQLEKSKPDTNRIEILHYLGKCYLLRRGENKIDLDSATAFFKEAVRLSDSLHIDRGLGKYESLCRLGETYFQRGDSQEGNRCFMQVISDYQKAGDQEREARTWHRLGRKANWNAATYSQMLSYFERAFLLYQQINNQEKVIETLISIADVHIEQGNLDMAERVLIQTLDTLHQTKLKSVQNPDLYHSLSLISRYKGQFDKGLLYALNGITYVEKHKLNEIYFNDAIFFDQLAFMYCELGQPQKSIEWYQKALDKWKDLPNLHQEMNISYMYSTASYLAEELIKQKKEKEALNLISGLTKKYGVRQAFEKARVAQTMAQCYQAMQKFDVAEKQYLEMVKWYRLAEKGYVNLGYQPKAYIPEMQYVIGNFYVEHQQYEKAGHYLKKVLETPAGIISLSKIKNLHLLLYRVDSAQGNYLSAINHFRLHKALNDSIFNDTKSRQIAELQIKYETEKKEQDIALLSNQSKLQQTKLQQANLIKNVTFGGIALLFVIMGLLYNQYRIKQRSNEQLQIQQKEISQKNSSLQHLLDEKEWLLKEVHHRVKNNLHTVMSLLESQSAYLENDALTAIKDSQHRVQAMSLIHQKLYLSENATTIDISVYLQELVNYLRDSFDTRQRIRFQLQLEPIELDVAQAIPLGLILNEAITNALKYAFPGNRDGVICITITQEAEEKFLLTVADNGIGLPVNFDPAKSTSLGIRLMKGLSKEIGARFSIKRQEGTLISIAFTLDRVLQHLQLSTIPEKMIFQP